MSEVYDNIMNRVSVRKYTKEMPSKEVLQKIMEAGVAAPSAKNNQSTVIIAVTNSEMHEKLAQANAKIGGFPEGQDPFYGAPVILIVLSKKELAPHVCDGSVALENMMLAAKDMDLGTCWIHRAKEEFEMDEWQAWLKTLGIEEGYEGVGHLALGYLDGDFPSPKTRKEGRIYFVD